MLQSLLVNKYFPWEPLGCDDILSSSRPPQNWMSSEHSPGRHPNGTSASSSHCGAHQVPHPVEYPSQRAENTFDCFSNHDQSWGNCKLNRKQFCLLAQLIFFIICYGQHVWLSDLAFVIFQFVDVFQKLCLSHRIILDPSIHLKSNFEQCEANPLCSSVGSLECYVTWTQPIDPSQSTQCSLWNIEIM